MQSFFQDIPRLRSFMHSEDKGNGMVCYADIYLQMEDK